MKSRIKLLLPALALFAAVSLHAQEPRPWHVIIATPSSFDISGQIIDAVRTWPNRVIVVFTPGEYPLTETLDLRGVYASYQDGAFFRAADHVCPEEALMYPAVSTYGGEFYLRDECAAAIHIKKEEGK